MALVTDLGSATGGDVSSFPFSALAVGMVNQRAGRRVDERRQEAAGFFYFRRLRQRRAPLVAATGCRTSSRPQPQRKPPSPPEANRGDAHQGLAMLESLVETAFSADSRLGSFLRSVASKETASWDVASGKLGVFPCAPPAFTSPASISRAARRLPRRARLRTVEQQLTGLIIAVLSFQVLKGDRNSANVLQDGG